MACALANTEVGHTYELPANLAMLLVLEGFARIERREAAREPDPAGH